MCELVEAGAQAIFGPSDQTLALHIISSICDALDIPHLNTSPDLDLQSSDDVETPPSVGNRDTLTGGGEATTNEIAPRNQQQQQHQQPPPPAATRPVRRRFAINLYPAQHLINAALLDVVQFLKWKRFAIVFEGDDGWARANQPWWRTLCIANIEYRSASLPQG